MDEIEKILNSLVRALRKGFFASVSSLSTCVAEPTNRSYENKLVGARGFEPPTTSPPD